MTVQMNHISDKTYYQSVKRDVRFIKYNPFRIYDNKMKLLVKLLMKLPNRKL